MFRKPKIAGAAIVGALLLAASAAHAGSIEIKITTAAAGASTVTTRIPDAQIARLIAYYGAAAGDVDAGTKDANGAPIMRVATRDENIARWVADIFTSAKNVVQAYEGREAAKVVAPLNLGVVGAP